MNRIGDRGIRRADIFLVAFFLFLALGCFIWFAAGQQAGQILRISHDGQVLMEVPLSQAHLQKTEGNIGTERYCLILCEEGVSSCTWYEMNPDLVAAVPKGVSYNLLAVSASGVTMKAADCRDQICVHHISIRGGGESIICLPHKLVVEIEGRADEESVDEITETETADKMAWNKGRYGYETDG